MYIKKNGDLDDMQEGDPEESSEIPSESKIRTIQEKLVENKWDFSPYPHRDGDEEAYPLWYKSNSEDKGDEEVGDD